MRVVTDTPGVTPYDAVLLLSFGGPEGPDDVMPFLENVTRGRGIPRERLEAVAGHYLRFGGRSPINDQNRALLAALRAELDARGIDVPLGWGNRNWSPYLVDALRELHEAGCRRVVVVVTSAYSSYSGCRQYREDLAAAVTALAAEGRELAVDKVRHYFNHPGFVAPVVDAVRSGLDGLPAEVRQGARVVFVTHSVPTAMNEVSGEGSAFGGGAYVSQHLDVASTVMAQVGGDAPAWDLVYCSRSGPPAQPWLEPDVNDHLRALAEDGVRAVVVVPVGFVSDHMEVALVDRPGHGRRQQVVHGGEGEEGRDGPPDGHVEQRLWGRGRGPGRPLRERRGHRDGEAARQSHDDDRLDQVQHREAEVPGPQAGKPLPGDAGGGRRGVGAGHRCSSRLPGAPDTEPSPPGSQRRAGTARRSSRTTLTSGPGTPPP